MKDQYRSRKKNRIWTGKYFFLAIFLLFIFFFFRSALFSSFLEGSEFGGRVKTFFLSKEELFLKNKKLMDQNQFYQNYKEEIYRLKEENKELKARLFYNDKLNIKRKLFDVLDYDPLGLYESLILKDEDEVLKRGDLIFAKYNILLGRVFEREGQVAKVKLFSSLGEKNQFFIVDGAEPLLKLEAEGQNSALLKVSAPRDLEFKNPDKVFLVHPENESYLVAKLVDNKFKIQDTNRILYFKILVNPELLFRVESEINDTLLNEENE